MAWSVYGWDGSLEGRGESRESTNGQLGLDHGDHVGFRLECYLVVLEFLTLTGVMTTVASLTESCGDLTLRRQPDLYNTGPNHASTALFHHRIVPYRPLLLGS